MTCDRGRRHGLVVHGETGSGVCAPSASDANDAITEALARANGVVSVAARALGLHRTQLYRLMDKLGIARDES